MLQHEAMAVDNLTFTPTFNFDPSTTQSEYSWTMGGTLTLF